MMKVTIELGIHFKIKVVSNPLSLKFNFMEMFYVPFSNRPSYYLRNIKKAKVLFNMQHRSANDIV